MGLFPWKIELMDLAVKRKASGAMHVTLVNRPRQRCLSHALDTCLIWPKIVKKNWRTHGCVQILELNSFQFSAFNLAAQSMRSGSPRVNAALYELNSWDQTRQPLEIIQSLPLLDKDQTDWEGEFSTDSGEHLGLGSLILPSIFPPSMLLGNINGTINIKIMSILVHFKRKEHFPFLLLM